MTPRIMSRTIVTLCSAAGVAIVVYIVFPNVPTPYKADSATNAPPAAVEPQPTSTSRPPPLQTGALEPPGVAKPLKLFAVYPGRTEAEGKAVLGAAEASSRTYVVGALLENNAKLTQVFSDRALLVRERRTYTLYLQDDARSDSLPPNMPGLTVGDFQPREPDVLAPAIRATDFLRAVPAYDGDLIAGFSVYPGSRGTDFHRWGLESGDVLLSVGGQPLNDPAQIEGVLEQLAGGAVLLADVRRAAGVRAQITLDGAALLAAAAPPPAPPVFALPLN